MAQSSYQKIILVEDLVLTWPSSFKGNSGGVINDRNDVEVIITSNIILPDAKLVLTGQYFLFNNISSLPFNLVLNDGSTILTTIDPGEYFEIYLIDTTTSNGTWRLITPLGGFNGIVELTAESADNSIVITGSPVTPPSGIIDFKLPTSLSNLKSVNNTDFLVVTNTVPALTFQTVELLGGSNINISNGNGLGPDPIISLDDELIGITSMGIGDLTISGNEIVNNNPNGDIKINSNGSGTVDINGFTISSSGAISGITNFIGISAFCVFTDTIVGVSNQIVVEQQSNIASVTGSAGTYTITFTTPMANINYAVYITVGSTGGSLPFISNAYYIVRQLNYVTIIVTDASGELVLSAPHGVSAMVIST